MCIPKPRKAHSPIPLPISPQLARRTQPFLTGPQAHRTRNLQALLQAQQAQNEAQPNEQVQLPEPPHPTMPHQENRR